MQCLIPRRRFLNKKEPLIELLTDANFVSAAGNRISGYGGAPMYIPTGFANGSYYLFSICNGYLGIMKVSKSGSGSTINSTVTKMNNSYGGAKAQYGTFYYADTVNAANQTQVFAGAFALVMFPNHSTADVDAILSSATYTKLYGNNSNSSEVVRTDSKSHKVILLAGQINTGGNQAANMGFRNGKTWEILKGTTDDGGLISGGYLYGCGTTNSVQYGASIIGID